MWASLMASAGCSQYVTKSYRRIRFLRIIRNFLGENESLCGSVRFRRVSIGGATSAVGQQRRLTDVHSWSARPPILTVKADVGDLQPRATTGSEHDLHFARASRLWRSVRRANRRSRHQLRWSALPVEPPQTCCCGLRRPFLLVTGAQTFAPWSCGQPQFAEVKSIRSSLGAVRRIGQLLQQGLELRIDGHCEEVEQCLHLGCPSHPPLSVCLQPSWERPSLGYSRS